MALNDDKFPKSLPALGSPSHAYEPAMAEAFKSEQNEQYGSPNYHLFDDNSLDYSLFDPNGQNNSYQAMSTDANNFLEPFRETTAQESSSDSQTNSAATSEDSSGEFITDQQVVGPGRISIPADGTDQHQAPNTGQNEKHVKQDVMMGNELFDFESAASSPTTHAQQIKQSTIKMPMRAAQSNGAPNRGYGPPVADSNSPARELPFAQRHTRHARHSSDMPQRYVDGSFAHNDTGSYSDCHATLPPRVFSQQFPPPMQAESIRPMLHLSRASSTQRVETQMHLRMTVWPLPSGVEKVHFQGYTMARTKLVLNPPPPKAPNMLELYAHCVCATAMEDEQKRQRAFDRAAQSTRDDNPYEDLGNPPPRSTDMADDDPRKPSNGGFVYICAQCMKRENKRTGRKKLKNEEEENLWLEDQPKRIVVFNKAEILKWQNWESYKDDDEASERNPKEATERTAKMQIPDAQFPKNAMQVRFPMRIQCYSRHHGEKLGYKVIFTLKDWQDNFISQAMTNASVITDDHKTQHSTRISGDFQNANGLSGFAPYGSNFPPQPGPVFNGASLGNRNSFSTPDLQSLHLSHQKHHSQSQSSFPKFGELPQATSGIPPSRNGSRPASPSALPGPQSKRRKGSGHAYGRARPDLAMTQINSSNARSPPPLGGQPLGPSFPQASNLTQAWSPNYPPFGLSTPPTSSHMHSMPATPNPANPYFYHRSHSVENFQGLQNVVSAPSSAWQSQVPSPESSPQAHTHPHGQSQGFAGTVNDATHPAQMVRVPVIENITPAEGPKAGGIEVTCLGQNFSPNSQILFGEFPATIKKLWNENALVCIVPPRERPGLVTVSIMNYVDQRAISASASPDPVLFTYIDSDEQELLKLALNLLHQKHTGNSAAPADIARDILSTMGMNSSQYANGLPSSYPQQFQHTAMMNEALDRRNLEDITLKTLEIIDLDEKPNVVSLNLRGSNGQAMLHISASLGYYRLLAGLLARGADPDTRDNSGMTPMHVAALHGNLRMVRKLRSSGADPTIRSLNGMRPAEFAATQEVKGTLDDLSLHPSFKRHERQLTNSTSWHDSLNSDCHTACGKVDAAKDTPEGLNLTDLGNPATWSAFNPQQPSKSRAASTNKNVENQEELKFNSDAAAFASNPAMSAWRDQFSAQIQSQIQQLQQSVQRALPLMPGLPDYQTHPVMRRISNLVPQRAHRAEEITRKSKDVDYRWWELLTGSSSAPPAYEEIYPDQRAQKVSGEKGPMALRAAGEALLDQKCEMLYDQPEKSAKMETINIGCGGPTEQQQQSIRKAHALKVKKIQSDRNLFLVWIPILFFIITAILKDWVPPFWGFATQAYTFLTSNAHHRRVNEV